MTIHDFHETRMQKFLRSRVYPWRYPLIALTLGYFATGVRYQILENAHWALQVFLVTVMLALISICFYTYKSQRLYKREQSRQSQSLQYESHEAAERFRGGYGYTPSGVGEYDPSLDVILGKVISRRDY